MQKRRLFCAIQLFLLVFFGDCLWGMEKPVLLYAANRGDDWGYIDKTGRFIVQPKFIEIGQYTASYEYAGRTKEGFWVAGNSTTESRVFDEEVEFVHSLGDGIVDGLKGDELIFTDTKNRITLPSNCTLSIGRFESGRGYAIVIDPETGRTVVDRDGKSILKTKDLIDLSLPGEGWCVEVSRTEAGRRSRMIGLDGKYLVDVESRRPLEFDSLLPFQQGLAVAIKNGKFFYINKEGARAFPAKEFDFAHSFSEGLASVRRDDLAKDSCWGFIDAKGDCQIDFGFRLAGSFSNGLAPIVVTRTKHSASGGYIDPNGKMKIEIPNCAPLGLGRFSSEGVARVVTPTRLIYINTQGAEIYSTPLPTEGRASRILDNLFDK